MPFTASAKSDAHALFDDQRPSSIGLTEQGVTGFVGAMCFRRMDDGEIAMRLAGEDGEVIDLRTNPVCAGRLAIALLDLINRNSWFDVDFRVTDSGSEIARITPLGRDTFVCDAPNG
jgi:hypothetical protein